jgi:hypothetical protein
VGLGRAGSAADGVADCDGLGAEGCCATVDGKRVAAANDKRATRTRYIMRTTSYPYLSVAAARVTNHRSRRYTLVVLGRFQATDRVEEWPH